MGENEHLDEQLSSFLESIKVAWRETSQDFHEFSGFGFTATISKTYDGRYKLQFETIHRLLGGDSVTFNSLYGAKLAFSEYLWYDGILKGVTCRNRNEPTQALAQEEVFDSIELSLQWRHGVAYFFCKDGEVTRQEYHIGRKDDNGDVSKVINEALQRGAKFKGLLSLERFKQMGIKDRGSDRSIYEWELPDGETLLVEVGKLQSKWIYTLDESLNS
jgi:hypothetical protein